MEVVCHSSAPRARSIMSRRWSVACVLANSVRGRLVPCNHVAEMVCCASMLKPVLCIDRVVEVPRASPIMSRRWSIARPFSTSHTHSQLVHCNHVTEMLNTLPGCGYAESRSIHLPSVSREVGAGRAPICRRYTRRKPRRSRAREPMELSTLCS